MPLKQGPASVEQGMDLRPLFHFLVQISISIGVWSCLGPESIISDFITFSAIRSLTNQ